MVETPGRRCVQRDAAFCCCETPTDGREEEEVTGRGNGLTGIVTGVCVCRPVTWVSVEEREGHRQVDTERTGRPESVVCSQRSASVLRLSVCSSRSGVLQGPAPPHTTTTTTTAYRPPLLQADRPVVSGRASQSVCVGVLEVCRRRTHHLETLGASQSAGGGRTDSRL